jgi:hypothetical protein
VLEPPEGAGVVELLDELSLEVDVEEGEVDVEEDDELSLEPSLFLLPPELLYRSAYQPPPLRMKPAPPETWRLAVAAWHFGHSVRGAALMDCSASQAWPQAVQAYS